MLLYYKVVERGKGVINVKKLGVLVALSTALIFSSFNIQASAATQTESNHIVKELNELQNKQII